MLCATTAFADLSCPTFTPVLPPSKNPLPPGAPPRATADHATLGEEGISTLEGSVRLEDSKSAVEANSMFYHRRSNWVESNKPLRYQDQNLGVMASKGEYNVQSGEGHFEDSQFTLSRVRARGKAQEVTTNGKGVTTFKNAEYTSCDPNNKDWDLNASSIVIDQGNTTGVARNAWLHFKGVPILYSPYFSFPVGVDRKSGFLAPTIGSTTKTGFELAAPYYFNIAANLDDTLTPRLMAARGVQLNNQFRYLSAHSAGELGLEYLPQDRRDQQRDRYLAQYNHRALLSEHWNMRVDFTHVSDKDYFVDLGDTLGTSSRTHLEQALRVAYQNASGWLTFRGLAQNFQTIDRAILPADQAPTRLPQLRLDLVSPQLWLVQPSLQTEFVRFTRTVGEEGNRLDLHPSLGLYVDRSAWFFKTQAEYHHTEYSLSDRAAGLDDTPTRNLPTYSLDTGLRFERLAYNGERIRTLEPRLFYLYTPFRQQNSLPTFDTSIPDFDYDELFTTNRFTGVDRIGDANQLTAAISSELINPKTGLVSIRSTIGQIYYFKDPRVELLETPSTTPIPVPGVVPSSSTHHSDFLAETDFRFTQQWSAGLSGQWDTNKNRFDRGSARLQYHADSGSVFNAAYRFRRDLLEQTDLSFIVPLSTQWRFVGRWNYSITDKQNLESIAGLEYRSCCYAVQTAYRRYVSTTPGHYNNGVFLQLELTGLGQIGNGINSLLDRDVRNNLPN